MKAAVFCFSDSGAGLAGRISVMLGLEKDCIHRRVAKEMEVLFAGNEALIFIGACGIAVRAIAPFIKSKTTDPAVIVIDDQARYVIPILSGHIGGANNLAEKIAEQLGASAVITTATDLAGKFSCDAWAVKNNCAISSMEVAKKISAAVLRQDVPIASEYPLPSLRPAGLVPGDSGEIGIYLGVHVREPFKTTLRLIPRTLVLGIGCRRGIESRHILDQVKSVLAEAGLDIRAVGKIASIDVKKDEAGLISFANELNAELVFFSADELNAAEGTFDESAFVKDTVGTGNVCARSAVCAGGKLLVAKCVMDGVTVAVAEEEGRFAF